MNGAHAENDIEALKKMVSKLEAQIEAMMVVIKLQGKKIAASEILQNLDRRLDETTTDELEAKLQDAGFTTPA